MLCEFADLNVPIKKRKYRPSTKTVSHSHANHSANILICSSFFHFFLPINTQFMLKHAKLAPKNQSAMLCDNNIAYLISKSEILKTRILNTRNAKTQNRFESECIFRMKLKTDVSEFSGKEDDDDGIFLISKRKSEMSWKNRACK